MTKHGNPQQARTTSGGGTTCGCSSSSCSPWGICSNSWYLREAVAELTCLRWTARRSTAASARHAPQGGKPHGVCHRYHTFSTALLLHPAAPAHQAFLNWYGPSRCSDSHRAPTESSRMPKSRLSMAAAATAAAGRVEAGRRGGSIDAPQASAAAALAARKGAGGAVAFACERTGRERLASLALPRSNEQGIAAVLGGRARWAIGHSPPHAEAMLPGRHCFRSHRCCASSDVQLQVIAHLTPPLGCGSAQQPSLPAALPPWPPPLCPDFLHWRS